MVRPVFQSSAGLTGLLSVLLLLDLAIVPQIQAQTLPQIVITKQQANTLFGSLRAKMIILENADFSDNYTDFDKQYGSTGPLYLIDFTADTLKRVLINSNARDAGSFIGDPMISPDGTRVAYNTCNEIHVCYLQAGGPGDTKVGRGFDQRWWVHPQTGDEYLIWNEVHQYGCRFDSTKISPVTAATFYNCGQTINTGNVWIQQITKGGTAAVGAPKILVAGHTLNGGRSPDGKYMCGARPEGAPGVRGLAELQPLAVENAFVKLVSTGQGAGCNGSISQDPAHPDWYLWLDSNHDPLHIQGSGNIADPSGGYNMNQWPEWSTHADYITSSLATTGSSAPGWFDPSAHDVFVYRRSTSTWTKITHGGGATHLWVSGAASSIQRRGAAQHCETSLQLRGGRLVIDGLAGTVAVSVFDARGKRILEKSISRGLQSIALPLESSTGFYVVRLTSRNGSVERTVIAGR